MSWRILEGDVLDGLATLSDGSVQTCVTSPPYFGLRDYGNAGQVGLEATPDEYVARLVDVFRQVRRVLRDDGTVWLNLGDSYNAHPGTRGRESLNPLESFSGYEKGHGLGRVKTCKPKDLLGIPWMVAFALRADGWYLRSDIIWAKPNPMPESVTDRPTKAHEYLFLLSKSPRYFWDADAIREDGAGRLDFGQMTSPARLDQGAPWNGGQKDEANGRNKRSVWTVATAPFPGAHFAVFPPKLIEPCILAGCPPRCCGVCGAPWERVTEVKRDFTDRPGHPTRYGDTDTMSAKGYGMPSIAPPQVQTTGWASTCDHQDDTGRSVVLDPFAGSGTTGVVARWHGRSFVGCELNPTYAAMARDRIETEGRVGYRAPGVPEQVAGQMDLLGAALASLEGEGR